LNPDVYQVRPRKDKRGVDLISDALPFGRLWYGEPNAASNAVDYAKFRSRSCRTVIRVYDASGNVIETHEPDDFEIRIEVVSKAGRLQQPSIGATAAGTRSF
jgi:hypothetical protein